MSAAFPPPASGAVFLSWVRSEFEGNLGVEAQAPAGATVHAASPLRAVALCEYAEGGDAEEDGAIWICDQPGEVPTCRPCLELVHA